VIEKAPVGRCSCIEHGHFHPFSTLVAPRLIIVNLITRETKV